MGLSVAVRRMVVARVRCMIVMPVRRMVVASVRMLMRVVVIVAGHAIGPVQSANRARMASITAR